MLITLSVLSTIGDILIFLLVLSLVINIHEIGHLIFAKRAGILCHEFSFGMGPRIWSTKKGETRFSIRAIPFGGFVSMAGEEIEAEIVKVGQKVRLGFDSSNQICEIVVKSINPKYYDYPEIEVEKLDLSSEEGKELYINEYTVKRDAMYVIDKNEIQIAPRDRSFNYKSKLQRFWATFGGPLMNFVLAFVVYLLIAFVVGVPDYDSTVIGGVSSESPASAVLEPGDIVLSINGVDVNSWNGATNSISSELATGNETYVFVVERDGEVITLNPMKPQYIFYSLGFTSAVGTDDLEIGSPLYIGSQLLEGDIIKSIDGVVMTTWQDVIDFSEAYTEGSTEEDPTVIVIERDGVEHTYEYVAYGEDVLDALDYSPFYSRIGIVGTNKFSFFRSFGSAGQSFVAASTSIYKTLGLMFSSNQVGVDDLSGFVGIFSMTSDAAKGGWISLLSWIGLLSVNLGIVNLLPIPALDGGRLVFIGYEAISGKKPNQRLENMLHTIMFFVLMALLVFITYNDILRLIGIK